MKLTQKYNQVKSVVVVVSTPLQYFNALELVQQLRPNDSYLIIAHPATTARMFQDLPALDCWKQIEIIQAQAQPLQEPAAGTRLGLVKRFVGLVKDVWSDIRVIRKLRRLLSKLPDPDVAVIGRVGELTHDYVAKNLKGSRIILVDDGATSVANLGGPSAAIFGRKQRLRRALYLLGNSTPRVKGIFSAYDVEPTIALPVYKNDYPYMRKLRRESVCDLAQEAGDAIWFLGQPLSQYGLYSKAEYRQLVLSIRQYYGSSSFFVYLPHPTETATEIDNIGEAIGVDHVLQTNLPVEALLLSNEYAATPSRVATFYSGAYRSLSLIFGSELPIDIFRMNASYWRGPMSLRGQIDRIYESLRSLVRTEDRFLVETERYVWTAIDQGDQ